MTRHPDEWRARRRGAVRLLRRLPATGAHTSTGDRRVLGPGTRVPALESKDRCRAILKNQGTRRSLPQIRCGCQYPLVRCCSSHRDKTGHGFHRARFERFAGHIISRRLAISPFVPVVTQCRLRQPSAANQRDSEPCPRAYS